jgi:hypothetical protein
MNPEIEIRITTRGVVSQGEDAGASAAGVPEPDPSMGELGAGVSGAASVAPSPLETVGGAEMDAGGAPSPEMGALEAAAAGAEALPTPVPLDEIENLGSSASAASSTNGVPTPEDDQG